MHATQFEGLKLVSWLEFDGIFLVVTHCIIIDPRMGENLINSKHDKRLASKRKMRYFKLR
jgi:hypothetical protein